MELAAIILLSITNIVFIYLFIKYKNKYKNNLYFYLEPQFNEVLNSMQQALLLFDKSDRLIFYNHYAETVLNFNKGKLGLTSLELFKDEKFDPSYKRTENNIVFDINYNNKIYLVRRYYIKEYFRKNVASKIIILNNVTEDRKIEETKRDFFSHASHELKSPLTAILGYSELIGLDMVEVDEYKEIVKKIFNQAQHMSLLVDDMSTLSKLESLTESEEFYENVDLNQLLKDVIYTLEPFIKEKNIYLNIFEEPVIYKCIKLDIHKLFKNLIENAIKYSNNDSTVTINLFKDNKDFVFEIKDEGIGISEEHLGRVFERFYRIDKGRLEPGTGLGLAIVKHTVIKYSGTIDINSRVNVGTDIKIKLKVWVNIFTQTFLMI